jgi:hypothetical protein
VSPTSDEQVRPVSQGARHDAQHRESPPWKWESRSDLQGSITPDVKSSLDHEGHGGAGAHFGQRFRLGRASNQQALRRGRIERGELKATVPVFLQKESGDPDAQRTPSVEQHNMGVRVDERRRVRTFGP